MSDVVASRPGWQRRDLVPLAQRLRYLQRYRVAAVLAVLALQLTGIADGDGWVTATVGGAAILLDGLAAVLVRRRGGDGGRWLFGIILLGDGLLFALLVQLTGGLATPVRYLVLLHVVIVTLVASHRTGVKLAIWHSLLALVVHEAIEIGWLAAPDVDDGTRALVVQLGLLWLVMLVTASASAVNEREILRRRYDLDALARMSSAFEQVTDLHGVAGVLVDHVVETFDARRVGVISLRDGDPLPLAGRGLQPVTAAGAVTGVLAEVAAQRATVLQTGLAADDEWLASQLPDPERLVVVPLVTGEEVGGALVVEFPGAVGERMERRIVQTIERFAAQGALALENARLHGELVALAETDGLTGVANRAALDRRLVAELARVERHGSQFLLLLCDLDRFKDVNDTHGHQTGDAVLVEVAQSLARNSRPYDTVARFGGEEFAVLMPTVTSVAPEEIADRFRAVVAAADTPVPVTASVGVVEVAAPTTPARVIAAADRALYRSKNRGRDRVTAADPILATAPGRDADG